MNTLGLVNVLNNDGNVLIDVAQMADNHIQNVAIHNALAEWNETDDPFSPETTQRLIGKLKGEMGYTTGNSGRWRPRAMYARSLHYGKPSDTAARRRVQYGCCPRRY